MKLTATEKLDTINIGLMLLSVCIAIVIPFELFLFSYAILGPLHYLTEISWLHDHKYYSKGKYDAAILIVIGLLVTITQFSSSLELEFPQNFNANLAYIAFVGSLIFAFVKNNFIRVVGLLLLIISARISENFLIFFSVFLPTLIHVYIFTGLFMLYGALKSKSRLGILSVGVLILCPFLLYFLFPDTAGIAPTEYGRNAYQSFKVVNQITLRDIVGHPLPTSAEGWDEIIFHSKAGILLMRFIAFAYTYHYLNWFSKTRVIQWHKVPKARFAGVVILWLISIGLYINSYVMGLQWLFFLSYLHVLLEFPLNYTSAAGIGRYVQQKFFGASAQQTPAAPVSHRKA